MQKKNKQTNYFFVDEAGDPVFYNRYGKNIVGTEGCSPILMLGFIKTDNPHALRKGMTEIKAEIESDSYLQSIPSIQKTKVAFHAKDDCPEVKEKVFKKIVELDFKAEFVVAHKLEDVFEKKYKGSENAFYSDLIIHLFKNNLHLSDNIICFSSRTDQTKQKILDDSLSAARLCFENKLGVNVISESEQFAQFPSNEPCLQIIDYMNWAVQRSIVRNEDRYLKFVESKINCIEYL